MPLGAQCQYARLVRLSRLGHGADFTAGYPQIASKPLAPRLRQNKSDPSIFRTIAQSQPSGLFQRFFLVHRQMPGLVALDFVLRRVF
jgi:hypothetical protein